MHTVEPLLPCCIPEVYEDAPLAPLGSVSVQVEGKGGQLLGRIAESEHNKQGWAKLVLIALERYSVALKRLTFNLR